MERRKALLFCACRRPTLRSPLSRLKFPASGNMPLPSAVRLSKFAKSVGRRCALPGCRQKARKIRCCGQSLCLACASHLLRVNADFKRCIFECPFCQNQSRVTHAGLRLFMTRCPSHARVVEGELGPCVLAHLPCAQGHHDCRESHVRLLPVASMDSLLARIDILGKRLDKAHDENKSFTRRTTLLTDSSPQWTQHGQVR